jgi:hypothetical protein
MLAIARERAYDRARMGKGPTATLVIALNACLFGCVGTTTLFAGEPGAKTRAPAGSWDACVARFGWEGGAP